MKASERRKERKYDRKEEEKALNTESAGSQKIIHEYCIWDDERAECKTKSWTQSTDVKGCWAGVKESVMMKLKICIQSGRFCTDFLKQARH